jgi:hypothetical protein
MTPTTLRSAVLGRRTQPRGSSRHPRVARFPAVIHDGVARVRRTPSRPARSSGPMWSLLLSSYYTHNPTEDAMPDPDAGPSHRPGARILGGPS